jgi:hypothetical protein
MINLIAVHGDGGPVTLQAGRAPWSVFQDGTMPSAYNGGDRGHLSGQVSTRFSSGLAAVKAASPSRVPGTHPDPHPLTLLLHGNRAWALGALLCEDRHPSRPSAYHPWRPNADRLLDPSPGERVGGWRLRFDPELT